MLMQRVLTAVILAPLTVVGILYLPPYATCFLFASILSLAILEWGKLTHKSHLASSVWVLTFLAVAATLQFVSSAEAFVLPLIVLANIIWLIISLVIWRAQTTAKVDLSKGIDDVLRSSLNCVLLLLAALFGALKLLNEDPTLLLLLLAAVWAADIGAYFVGRQWGKRKLAANISPGKTWEGVFGGIGFSAITLVVATHWIVLSQNQRTALVLVGILASCLSVFGDLFESLLKRTGGFKDSGNILPGHGGVLDRIDGLIAAIPIYSAGVFLWVSKL